MLNYEKNKFFAVIAIIPFLILINSCEQATVKPVTKKQNLNCLDNTLSDYLIAYYPFTDGSLDNYMNNGYNLTSINTIEKTTDRHNNPNCAIYINQNNQDQVLFLSTGDPITDSSFLDKPISISIWYKPLEVEKRNGGNFEMLIGNNNTLPFGLFEDNWYVGLYDCRRPTAVFNKINIWDDIDFQQFGSCDAVMNNYSNNWIHLVITHNNGILKMYIAGKLVSTSTNIINTNQGKNENKFLTLFNDFRGDVDEIMIFKKEITQDEVLKLYNAVPCCE